MYDMFLMRIQRRNLARVGRAALQIQSAARAGPTFSLCCISPKDNAKCDWPKADLAAWSKLLQTGPPQARESIGKTLRHWKADTDLAGLREPNALAKLPPEEQQTCRALWAKVDALVTKAAEARPKARLSQLETAITSGLWAMPESAR
jgi:hypothetical protein